MNLAVSFGVLGLASIAIVSCAEDPVAIAQPTPQKPASVIDGYRKWTKVNATPYAVKAPPMGLCRNPAPSHVLVLERTNPPGKDYVITVYVNKIGEQAMKSKRPQVFPQGSVIVKEKRYRPEDKQPEFLTVMVKRAGGWEYHAFHADGFEIEMEPSDVESCQSCHKSREAADSVFRDYAQPPKASVRG